MRRAVEWFLYLHSENPKPAHHLIQDHHFSFQPRTTKTTEETIGPAHYDAVTTAEEGLWNRKGWAGRTQR